MARIGVNPARGKVSTYRPARATVAVLTYIPHLDGYFRHRLDVLKLTLSSLVAHTTVSYDLLVFDNGSCPPVVDYLRELRDTGSIDYLVLSSRNLGKIGAFRVLFDAAPGEVVAYADDDIFFYPGWLEAQLQILRVYPQVGMVSGMPVRDASERARKSLDRFIQSESSGLSVSRERRFPDEWEIDWAMSTSRDPESHLQKLRGHKDLILNYHGVEAFGSASHFQFVAPKDVIRQALPQDWSGKLMGHMVELDEAVDALGYLRLSTVDRYTRHLGNVLSSDVLQTAQQFGLAAEGVSPPPAQVRHWLLRVPGGGRMLRRLYNWLFYVLHGRA